MPTATTKDDNKLPLETTPLSAPNQGQSTGLVDNDALSENSDENQILLDEMNTPWPATFERSISLLSSPIMTPRQADLVTKSPKPGISNLFSRNASNYRDQRRGFDTPEPARNRLIRPATSLDDSDLVDSKKVKSVDFRSTMKQELMNTTRAKQKEDAEAHAYRQRLLESQRKKGIQESIMSPGYDREVAMRQRAIKKTQKTVGDKATFTQCVFNMCNILMGVGMLGLPFVFKSAGWLGGLLVTISFGSITWRTSILIGRQLNGDPRPSSCFDDSPFKSPVMPGSAPGARMRSPMTSFPQIAREAFGDKGRYFLACILYFELFSCLCIFLVSVGDHLYILFPNVSKAIHIVITSVALTIPTAFLRTPRLLSYLSMVGTFSTISMVLSVLVSAVFEGDISERAAEHKGITGPTHILWSSAGLPTALGLVAYTFSGHAIVPSIYSSMERPQDFEQMIHTTFAIVTAACCVVACSGYYMFGAAVEDQVTLSLEQNSSAELAMKCLTWLIILTAFSKFTLNMFPLALGIEEIVAPFVPNDTIMAALDSIIKLTFIVLSLLVALFVPSFSFICALVGLICTMSVSVIFPAAAHLVLFGSQLSLSEKILNWIFVLVGVIVAVVGTAATI